MMEDTVPALVCNANANLALQAAYHPKALQGPEFGIANPPAELGRILWAGGQRSCVAPSPCCPTLCKFLALQAQKWRFTDWFNICVSCSFLASYAALASSLVSTGDRGKSLPELPMAVNEIVYDSRMQIKCAHTGVI